MASQPLVNLKQEDFPTLSGAIGSEADRLFRALNLTTQQVQTVLGGGFTLLGNGRAFKKVLDLKTTSLPASFKNTLPSVSSVRIAQAMDVTTAQSPVPVALPNPGWTTKDDQVVVSDLGTLTAGKTYRVTFIVEG